MKLNQNLELRKLLVPELKQSLEILSLPLLDLKTMIDEELVSNPFLEERMEAAPEGPAITVRSQKNLPSANTFDGVDPFAQLAQTPSLQDTLLRQLEISALSEEELQIGKEIIGNLDDDGYLTSSLKEIAASRQAKLSVVERTLALIHKFEPLGCAAQNIQECLLIQCNALKIDDPLMTAIITDHLDDVGRKKFKDIARALKTTLPEIETRVKQITALNPRPGQNSPGKASFQIVPDIFIDEKDGALEVVINREDIPSLGINEEYRNILKSDSVTPEAKEFLRSRLEDALNLLRAISRRQGTLRKVLEVITDIQKDALLHDMSHLKPLTLQQAAERIGMHESTVCRVVMNKYAQTPQGIISLKSLFTNSLSKENGQNISSSPCKSRIRELIESEDRKKPLSDEDLAGILLKEDGIRIARRTVAKYREEMKILPTSLRRER